MIPTFFSIKVIYGQAEVIDGVRNVPESQVFETYWPVGFIGILLGCAILVALGNYKGLADEDSEEGRHTDLAFLFIATAVATLFLLCCGELDFGRPVEYLLLFVFTMLVAILRDIIQDRSTSWVHIPVTIFVCALIGQDSVILDATAIPLALDLYNTPCDMESILSVFVDAFFSTILDSLSPHTKYWVLDTCKTYANQQDSKRIEYIEPQVVPFPGCLLTLCLRYILYKNNDFNLYYFATALLTYTFGTLVTLMKESLPFKFGMGPLALVAVLGITTIQTESSKRAYT